MPSSVKLTAHFTSKELGCRCGCGKCKMHPDLLTALESLRIDYGSPIVVTSGYRCPAHNKAVGSTRPAGVHTYGLAVDIAVGGKEAFNIVALARGHGFTRLGIKQHGPSRYLHLDIANSHNSTGFPSPAIWSYP